MNTLHRPRRLPLTLLQGLCLSLSLAAALLIPLAAPVAAVEEPAPPSGVVLQAQAMLAGNVRPGAWTAISVQITNDGPSLSGELRIRTPQQGRSVYGAAVELPNGSRQQHTLYAQPPLFGTRLHVDLVSQGRTLLTQDVPIKTHDTYAPITAVVAERPEGILDGVGEAARNPQAQPAVVITLTASDLPPRVEAWSAIDRLVWQDVDAALLSTEQLAALRLWLNAGGRLVIVGGTTGAGTLAGFPQDILAFVPTQTVDVAAADLAGLLGRPPAGISSAAAVGGTLARGAVWARSGDHVIAAEAAVGQGTVTQIGLNPAEAWLAESSAGRALWRRALPQGRGPMINPLSITDDSVLIGVLNLLPAIDLPPIEQLFLLLFGYVALIGPVNYLVLRRLDRREWAWLTMPALVAIFALASYGMGASLKGSDVIVNQVAVVRAAEGSDRGLGQVYVGVFSPSRRTFDVRIPGGALLSSPISQGDFGRTEQPLDVLFGDPSRLRNFEVGFGVLRGFRAEAPTDAPLIEADLTLVRGRLEGSVTNRSETSLDHVAVVYAGGVAVLPRLGAGETSPITLDASGNLFAYQLSERIFGSTVPRDEAQTRALYIRRSVLDQLSGWGSSIAGTHSGTPLLLGWRSGPILDVELVGEQPNRVGDSLFLVPLSMTIDREAVFGDRMMIKTIVENDAVDGFSEGSSFYLGRGSMTIEARPAAFDGRFRVSSLEVALTQEEGLALRGTGTPIEPLPDDQQPAQDDPVGAPTDPGRAPDWERPPDIQLFDHGAARWLEFPRFESSRAYRISEPERFVDDSGRVLVRVVNRDEFSESKYFGLLVRLEGIIE